MKVTVLGCGALGQLWLIALAKHGHQVQGWLRMPQSTFRVQLVDIKGQPVSQTFPANSTEFLRQSDLLLVTLKAWQITDALNNLIALIPLSCPIVLLHNGMGVLEQLAMIPQPLLSAVTTHAVRNDGEKVTHVGVGTTHIGPANQAAIALSCLAVPLHSALPEVIWSHPIAAASWQKLAINCVINPLTVRYNCPNGDLRYHQQAVRNICHEVVRVMTHEVPNSAPEQHLLAAIEQVINSSAENISSMLQDIRMCRRTEIDYITGYLLQRAGAHGLTLPINSELYRLIKQKEKSYGC